MRSYTKLLFAALIAALIMSMAAGTASASRSLSLNNGGVRTFSYSDRYTFTNEEGGFRVVCRVLRTITYTSDAAPKTAGVVIANTPAATGIDVRECTGGTVRVLQERAWKIRFDGFTGTLPAIRTIRLTIEPNGGGFLVEAFFGIARCLYGGNVSGIATVNAASEVTEIRAEERPNAATVNLGGVECPAGVLRGNLRPLTGTPAIRLRLI